MVSIGILGDGQLARMLTLSAYPLGIQTHCFSEKTNTSASQVGAVYAGRYASLSDITAFTAQIDVLTYESENIDAAVVETFSRHCPVYPSIKALQLSQDRWHEKNFFRELGIPTTNFFRIDEEHELSAALAITRFPAILKTRRLGYDGKGQFLLRSTEDIPQAWATLNGVPLILEAWVTFDREVSLIAVRDRHENCRFYPLTENTHQQGILTISRAPYDNPSLQQQAEDCARTVLAACDYVGVLALEFFCCDGELIINEMAPRVHNSGHWTIEGASTSQFENHIRAISNLPLGNTDAHGCSLMLNIIGNPVNVMDILALPHAHYHDYGKSPYAKRKLGHVTLHHTNLDVLKTIETTAYTLIHQHTSA